ncbi:hypothetical protein N658DRAFT_174865 [Parathielavia hyrcaniae]|uniref:Secreted protein n=1 Tax=Parathielavia hyrcaniae TaxID=113614 RepID=A0AAN6Q1A7_9PEZI|nr:hypothetical protein N658DRAFT_174865 [Parathielavia hyrcaniae]
MGLILLIFVWGYPPGDRAADDVQAWTCHLCALFFLPFLRQVLVVTPFMVVNTKQHDMRKLSVAHSSEDPASCFTVGWHLHSPNMDTVLRSAKNGSGTIRCWARTRRFLSPLPSGRHAMLPPCHSSAGLQQIHRPVHSIDCVFGDRRVLSSRVFESFSCAIDRYLDVRRAMSNGDDRPRNAPPLSQYRHIAFLNRSQHC